jgi:hypothetical protein
VAAKIAWIFAISRACSSWSSCSACSSPATADNGFEQWVETSEFAKMGEARNSVAVIVSTTRATR